LGTNITLCNEYIKVDDADAKYNQANKHKYQSAVQTYVYTSKMES